MRVRFNLPQQTDVPVHAQSVHMSAVEEDAEDTHLHAATVY
jgi:hypothetical protein